jgi:hypothetical protein
LSSSLLGCSGQVQCRLTLCYSDTTKPTPIPTSSQSQTPEGKPTSAAAVASTTTSPLLDALASNAFNTSFAKSTNEWARNVPAFSGSPGNLISLSGSPPTVPSSYEERSILAGWNQRERGTSNGQLPSASPPTHRRRPHSYQMDGQHPFEDQASYKAGNAHRRSSMYSQQSQRYGPNPPLPHQPQAHFYGAPDPLLGVPSRASGMKPGAHGYYCGFDSLSIHGPGASKPVDSVILSGYEGGLHLYAVSKYGLKKLVSIEDLHGGVYFAKVLPWVAHGKSEEYFPLVAVVLHGPVIPSIDTLSGEHAVHVPSEAESLSRAGTVRGSPRELSGESDGSQITYYQTTVEVYSLSTKKRISTLLALPKVPLNSSITRPHFVPPLPGGALKISAEAGSVVVASGITGEIWIYNQYNQEDQRSLGFRCIGKVWTTVQQAPIQESSRSPELADPNSPFIEPQIYRQQHRTALYSLKGRWLAYSPPTSTTQVPLRASVPTLNFNSKSPGLNSFAPPQVPPVNCAVDMPEGDTLLNRVAREATQAAIKGAKWVGDQSYLVWNNYWNKPSTNPQASGPAQYWPTSSPPQQDHIHGFPPTHGEALQQAASNTDPTLISILDLEKLATIRTTSSAIPPHPFATFKAPLGCSFMSFSPSGLALFTASGKGEVQFVWDLMRLQYTKSSALQTPHLATLQGQHIRQLAIFTRMTPARIVDVVWTTPHGERIAMVTDRNTVHFWDLPPSAFSWPPLRRRIKAALPKVPASGDTIEAPKSATAIATSAVSAAWSLAQPLMKRPRGLSGPGRSSITAASMTAQAGHGGKAIANGISKSFGAATGTIESLYKSGENRLHLLRGTTLPTVGCIKWLGGQQRDYLAAVVDGAISIYAVKQRKTTQAHKQQISISRKPLKMELPLIPDQNIAPAVLRAMDLEDELDLTETETELRWDLNCTSAVKADSVSATDSSIPQAEIESNAPYQPFHTDRRVGLYVYSTASAQPQSPSMSALLAPLSLTAQEPIAAFGDVPWVFGRPINSMKLDIGPSQAEDDDFNPSGDHQALPTSAMERVTTKISEPDEEVEQIVITTRRRRGTVRDNAGVLEGDEDGFFEDDCEVLDFATQRV